MVASHSEMKRLRSPRRHTFFVCSCAQVNMLLAILTVVRERWFWMHTICGTRSDCQGTWFSKDGYILLTALQSVPFALAHRLLVGRGHFDRYLSRFTAGRKSWIDEIAVVSAQSNQGINYRIEDGSCSFFSGLIGIHEKRSSTLPYLQLQSP